MGTITIKKGKGYKTYTFPDSYNECNEKQFIACCKYFLDVSKEESPTSNEIIAPMERIFLSAFV